MEIGPDRVDGRAEGEGHRQWVDWVAETGGDPPGKAAERLQPRDEDVPVPVDSLEAPVREHERLAALANDRRVARYLLPLPLVGAGISVYHLLVENGVVKQAQACLISAPGGCATKWIEEFGYVTIPGLALTGFVLCFAFLLLATAPPPTATVRER